MRFSVTVLLRARGLHLCHLRVRGHDRPWLLKELAALRIPQSVSAAVNFDLVYWSPFFAEPCLEDSQKSKPPASAASRPLEVAMAPIADHLSRNAKALGHDPASPLPLHRQLFVAMACPLAQVLHDAVVCARH